MSGQEIWNSAMRYGEVLNPIFAVRPCFYALNVMLAEAEHVAARGDTFEAVRKVRELQAYLEKLVGIMAPREKARPKLVDTNG